MKVIFLDFDGVLNHINQKAKSKWEIGYDLCIRFPSSHREKGYFHADFSARNLESFYKLYIYCLEKNIKFVISSSWRVLSTVKEFDNFFKELFSIYDTDTKEDIFIGRTSLEFVSRGEQIQDYLNEHKEITDYIVLDDEIGDIKTIIPMEHIVETEMSKGLTDKEVNIIIDYFKE